MNRKRIIHTAAMSALLVSAIASPIAANAAAVPALADKYAASQTAAAAKDKQAAQPATIAVQWNDPLALAKQYAPDTVPEWQRTLDRYDELIKSKVQVVAIAAGSAVTGKIGETGEGKASSTAASVRPAETIAVTAVDGSSATLRSSLGKAEAVGKLTASFNVTASSSSGDSGSGKGNVVLQKLDAMPAGELKPATNAGDDATGVQPSADSESVATLTAVAVSPDPDSVFSGQIELSEAVESKDTAKIKQALSDLLAKYKAQIEKLESVDAE